MTEPTVDYGYVIGHTATKTTLQACVGKGWADIVGRLFELCFEEGVAVTQVKEKYGGLRFYVGSATEQVLDTIDEAEQESYKVCEHCGEPGEPRKGGWILTLCDKHEAERK